jgi:alpha-tubulin suppressor-like RCC1 family protein
MVGSEDFAKRFKELKSQYEAATKCIGNVEQVFKDASLANMTRAPEVVSSIVAAIDGDMAKTSKVYEQTSDLSIKMELANKAMKMVTKVHHDMCMTAVQQSGPAHR